MLNFLNCLDKLSDFDSLRKISCLLRTQNTAKKAPYTIF